MTPRYLPLPLFALLAACTAAPPPARAPAPAATACVASAMEQADTTGLGGCSHIFGDLSIENTGLADLTAFSGVRSVSGTLFIGANQHLASLRGLEGLRSVGHVVVVNNPALRDLSGLSGLVEARAISILDNPQLMAVSGPESLRHLDGLVIADNDGLISLSGFSGLVSAGDVVIANNPALIRMSGLAELSFAENLYLENNPRLAPVPSLFKSLASVNADLSVSQCPGIKHSDLEPKGDGTVATLAPSAGTSW